MLRLCELTGLSPADIAEISGFIVRLVISATFVGNMVVWFFRESVSFLAGLASILFDLIKGYIEKKLHR